MMGVRFLLVGDTLPTNPWNRDRLPAIKEAARGFDFEIMDIYEFNSTQEAHYIHTIKGGEFFNKKDVDFSELNRRFYSKVMSYKCDILILGTTDNYSLFLLPETVERFQKKGIFVIGILGDDEFTYKRNRLYLPMFDKVIAYVRRFVDYYNLICPESCYYLPSSCYFPEPDFRKLKVDEDKKRYDVTLMGAPSGVRPRLLEALVDAGINVAIFGSPKWEEHAKLKDYYHGYVPSDEIMSTIKLSKIVLGLLEDHLTGALHMNTKIWDAVKYGQMCITTRYLPLVEDYGLIEDEEIVMYDSPEDLVDKVKYYLERPELRERIAEKLFNKVKQRFDYADMYRNLYHDLEVEYTKRQRVTNPEDKTDDSSSSITIIDLSDTGKSYPGFNCLNISQRAGWKKRLRENYSQMIKTPYVVLTSGGFEYSPYLNKVVELFPDEFLDGRAILRPISCRSSGRVIADMVVWSKETFLEQYLARGILSRYSYTWNFSYSFGNLRLCDAQHSDSLHGGLAFMGGCLKRAIGFASRLTGRS